MFRLLPDRVIVAFVLWWDKTQWHSAPRWKKWLGALVPGRVLDDVLFRLVHPVLPQQEQSGPTSFPETVHGRSRKVKVGSYILEGEAILPRLVRTKEGREVLQYQLIKERQDAAPTAG